MEVTRYKRSLKRKEFVGENLKKCSRKEFFTTSVFLSYDFDNTYSLIDFFKIYLKIN